MEYKLAKDIAPPARILIMSDDSIMEYVRTIPKNKVSEMRYVYKFVQSFTKKDLEFEITPEFLGAQFNNYFKSI